MAKIIIETKKTVDTAKEKITALLKKKVSTIFDREPNASVQDAPLAKLVEEIQAICK